MRDSAGGEFQHPRGAAWSNRNSPRLHSFGYTQHAHLATEKNHVYGETQPHRVNAAAGYEQQSFVLGHAGLAQQPYATRSKRTSQLHSTGDA
jgi:hypothetical protein